MTEDEFSWIRYRPKTDEEWIYSLRNPVFNFMGGNFMDGSDIGKYGKKFLYRESFALRRNISLTHQINHRFQILYFYQGTYIKQRVSTNFR